MKKEIPFSEFLEISDKLEITIGNIVSAERVPKKDKLIKLVVNFGDSEKTVVTNLGKDLEPEAFIGVTMPFITNLAPSNIGGVDSFAMIMPGVSLDGILQLTNFTPGTKLL